MLIAAQNSRGDGYQDQPNSSPRVQSPDKSLARQAQRFSKGFGKGSSRYRSEQSIFETNVIFRGIDYPLTAGEFARQRQQNPLRSPYLVLAKLYGLLPL